MALRDDTVTPTRAAQEPPHLLNKLAPPVTEKNLLHL